MGKVAHTPDTETQHHTLDKNLQKQIEKLSAATGLKWSLGATGETVSAEKISYEDFNKFCRIISHLANEGSGIAWSEGTVCIGLNTILGMSKQDITAVGAVIDHMKNRKFKEEINCEELNEKFADTMFGSRPGLGCSRHNNDRS